MQDITTLFLDIGGVLLTNGWDRQARRRAAEEFDLDFDAIDARHHLVADTYETGKLTLSQYLHRVVFYEERHFTPAQFKRFMFAQTRPYPEMIELVRALRVQHGLRIFVISNEGLELTQHRVDEYDLKEFVDCFVVSCFVHLRKPDEDIYRLALELSHASPSEVLYLEDRPVFVQVAQSLGIRSIRHGGFATTCKILAELGLAVTLPLEASALG